MRDMYMGSEMGVSLPIIDSADTDRNVWSAQKTKNEIGIVSRAEIDIKMLGWSVPMECPIQNEIDGNKFIQKVGRVDASELVWTKATTGYGFYAELDTKSKSEINKNNDAIAKFLLDGYTVSTYKGLIKEEEIDNLISYRDYSGKGSGIALRNTKYENVDDLKESLKNVYLYYEVETPTITQIDGNENSLKIKNEINEEIANIDNEISDIQNNKIVTNFLKLKRDTSITKSGITCTPNGDGTYTLNGTSTSAVNIELGSPEVNIPSGEYRLIGCPKDGATTTYRLGAVTSDGNIFDYGYGRKLSISSDVNISRVIINIASPDVVLDNFVFKPMITINQNATYDDFVPYTGITGRLNNDVAVIKEDVDGLQISQGRNLISYPYWNQSALLRGIDYTINDDGSVNCNGTASGGVANFVFFDNRTSNVPNLIKKDVEYTLSSTNQCPTRVNFAIRTYDSSKAVLEQFTVTNDLNNIKIKFTKDFVYSTIYIAIGEGVTVDNLVVYPMLEEGSIAHSYEPTTESNATLSQEKLSQGRNLIPYPYHTVIERGTSYTTIFGINVKIDSKGVISTSGTFTNTTTNAYLLRVSDATSKTNTIPLDKKNYILTFDEIINDTTNFKTMLQLAYYKGGTSVSTIYTREKYISINNTDGKYDELLIGVWMGNTSLVGKEYNRTMSLQLEEGTIAHAYEPTVESNVTLKTLVDNKIEKSTIRFCAYDGGKWQGDTIVSGFTSETTIQDIITYLNTNKIKSQKVSILANSNVTTFNKSLGSANASIVEIVGNYYSLVVGNWNRCYIQQTVCTDSKRFIATVDNTTVGSWKEVTYKS